jgi:alkaline phosphatase
MLDNEFELIFVAAVLAGLLLAASDSSRAENTLETTAFWLESGKNSIKAAEQFKSKEHCARNVILFVGDVMGVSTITAARIYEGKLKPNNRGGKENSLSFEQLPYLALSKTYSVNQQTPVSVPTMTKPASMLSTPKRPIIF